MAFIYKYELIHNKDDINLNQYKDKMEEMIKKYFGINLKEVYVYNDKFEFKLYRSVSISQLQNMGRELKKLHIGFGFIRIQQTLYAISQNNDDDESYIELFDDLVDKQKEFSDRAKRYSHDNDMIGSLRNNEEMDYNQVILNAYLDVMAGSSFNVNLEKETMYKIVGWHRHISKDEYEKLKKDYSVILIDKCDDIQYMRRTPEKDNDISFSLKSTVDLDENMVDCIVVLDKKKQSKDERVNTENFLKLNIQEKDELPINKKDIKNKFVQFKVHNIGQALATSLSIQNEKPFMYFDYGLPYGENYHTIRDIHINIEVDTKTVIIISHLDKDHWNGLSESKKAYTCLWYIPDQNRGYQINHKLSEIFGAGGKVYIIKKDIDLPLGKIVCAKASRYKPSREATKRHETGLTFLINARDDNDNKCNILVAGDQDYDYSDNSTWRDLKILVATHHGGRYSWTVHSQIPVATLEEKIIIYSYGLNNTHHHPSKLEEYQQNNWNNEHHTQVNGDYLKMLKF